MAPYENVCKLFTAFIADPEFTEANMKTFAHLDRASAPSSVENVPMKQATWSFCTMLVVRIVMYGPTGRGSGRWCGSVASKN